MARRGKSYEEARKEAEEFFRGDSLRSEVFLSRYALRSLSGEWLETTPEPMWNRVAATMARPEKDRAFWRREFRALLEDFKFLPAGRILFGAKNPRASTLFNCYYIPVRGDSVDGITRWINEASRTYSLGGGVGTNIDVLRPRGAHVRNAGVESSGSASFMEVFSTVTGVMGGSRGRRGALMITTRVDHPDVLEFITVKSDPERRQVRNANISVRITDDFMQRLDRDEEVRLWFTTPHERIERPVPARRIWRTLLESAWASAEPGVLFWDTILRESTARYNGMEVEGVNVCGEIPMEPYGACNLGSVNLAAFVKEPFTERAELDRSGLSVAVRTAVRFLDNVIDVGASRHAVREQRRSSLRSRRVGLGILGMADCLAALGLVYGSEPSLSLLDRLMGAVKETAYEESVLLAQEKGSFPAFDADRHLGSPYVQRLPESIRTGIRAKGLRNCALLAVAPTGSISCLAGTSSGVEPIFSLSYLRHVAGQAYRVEHPLVGRYRERHGSAAFLPEAFITARRIDPDARVRLQALIQRHVDQSISSTVNLAAETPLPAVEELYRKAWESGCKGITVFREGTRAPVLEPAGREGVYRAESGSPVGVCTFCEVPGEQAQWSSISLIPVARDEKGIPKVLSVSGLRRLYGNAAAVDGVSFEVGPNEIVGLLGPNGAGKTTTINMILGVLEPSAGTIRIEGVEVTRNRSRALERTNFAAVYSPLPGNLTVLQNLRVFGLLYGVKDLSRRIEALVDQLEIGKLRHVKCGALSSGEQTRVSLAKAMLNRPRLLLLDEPTASLDPAAARDVRAKIREFAGRETVGILWTSHNMVEIADVCDRVLFLSRGKILLEGDPRTLPREHGKETLEELFIAVAREPLAISRS